MTTAPGGESDSKGVNAPGATGRAQPDRCRVNEPGATGPSGATCSPGATGPSGATCSLGATGRAQPDRCVPRPPRTTGRAQPDQCPPIHAAQPRKQLNRREIPGHVRFLTFSCHKRLPLLADNSLKRILIDRLRAVQTERPFELFAWVIMPEHVHLLIRPDLPQHPVSELLRSLKRPVAERALRELRRTRAPILARIATSPGTHRFWQVGGGYDRNIYTVSEFRQKFEYIHLNPVTRRLVGRPEDYRWSSARSYMGHDAGPLQLDPLPL